MDKDRRLALPLSFTTLLTIILLAMAALAGAYVWGVMSGRHGEPPAPVAAAPAPLPEPDPAILKARELEFAHVLKGEPAPAPVPSEKPADATPPSQVVQGEEGSGEEKVGPAAATEVPAGAERQLHDYVFQMAALKDEQAVDSLRQKLEGLGMRTRMERSGKLFLVLVLLRGDEGRAAEIVNIARNLRLGEPLVRSKKAVAQ